MVVTPPRLRAGLPFLLLAILAAGHAERPAPPPVRIHLEEGAFTGLPSHVDWHTRPGQGWYLKEHYHASSYAFAVCDDQSPGARCTLRIGRELPPGAYDVWVRHVRMRTGGTNRIRVSLGNLRGVEFAASAAADIAWGSNDSPRDYRWAKARLETPEPVTLASLEAASVERTGIGDVPEYALNTVLVDAVEITSLDALKAEVRGNSASLLPTVEASPPPGRGISAPQPPSKPVLDTGPDRKGNLVRCGGFEAAAEPFWFVWKQETTGYWLTSEFFDDRQPADGRYALRLRGCANPYARGGSTTFGVTLSSEPLRLRPHRRYTLSFQARTDDPKAGLSGGLALGPRGNRPAFVHTYATLQSPLSERWQRFSTSIEFHDEAQQPQIFFTAGGFQGDPDERCLSHGSVYLDGVQLEEGELSEYRPHGPAEAGLISDSFRLFYSPGPLELLFRAAGSGGRKSLDLEYELLDLAGRVAGRGRRSLRPDGSDQRVSIDFPRRGAYLFRYRLRGIEDSEAMCDLAILDPPRAGSRTSLGIYTGYGPSNLAFFQRAGARYYLTLCDQALFRGHAIAGPGPQGVQGPVPEDQALDLVRSNSYVWWDDLIERIQGHGMKVIPEFLSYEMPGWAGGRDGPAPAVWSEHIRKVVSHYAANPKLQLDTWITGDEVRESYDTLHESAHRVVKSILPKSRVMTSTCGGVLDHFVQKFGSPLMDACGGSWLGATKWEYRHLRHLRQQHPLPFWNIGVGWSSTPMDGGAAAAAVNLSRGRFAPLSNVLFAHAILAPEIWCTYTNRYTMGIAFGTNDYRTGGFVPHGLYFTLAVAFLQDAEPGDEIELELASGLDAFSFSKGGKTWAVLSPSQAFAGEPQDVEGFDLILGLDPDSVRLYDTDLSPVSPRSNRSPLRYRLEPFGLVLLEDLGLGPDALLRAVRQVQAERTHYAQHRFRRNPATGGLDLVIQLFDSSAPRGEGTFSLGERVPLSPQASREIPAAFRRGRTESAVFPLDPVFGLERPIGNLIVDYRYRIGDRVLFQGSPHLWCVVSRFAPRPAEDAPRPETQALVAAWPVETLGGYLFATQRYGGSYHTAQVRRGGERYRFSGEEDASARLFSRWDSETLHLAFEVRDDSFVRGGDRILAFFDTDLEGDGNSGDFDRDDYEIAIDPDPNSGACRARLTSYRGEKAVTGSVRKTEEGYWVEADLPWDDLGRFRPDRMPALGFNAVLIDADPGQDVPTEIMLSARPSYQLRDPRGFTQMLLVQ
ncbi:MAG: hypothetical protein HYU36_22855 [Planctomycetes bacterium]|nr:hypothetical protein [Planctomycetota bacterium]